MKKILYVDMDNVLVDFPSAFQHYTKEELEAYDKRMDEIPDIFSKMEPLDGAVEAFHVLSQHFDTYILSTSPWMNHSALQHKLEWVKKYLGGNPEDPAYKRLILSHHKNLNRGDYLIDDRTKNGVDKFEGEHIHFGTEEFPDWNAVIKYLIG